MKAAAARKLIGKAVSYYDSRRSFSVPTYGTVLEVQGRNIRIGYPDTPGEWHWLPDMVIEGLPVMEELP